MCKAATFTCLGVPETSVLQLDTSTVVRTAFALQLSVSFTKTSMNKKTFFGCYSVIHVLVCEELQDVYMFTRQEHGELCTYPNHIQQVQYLGPGDFAQRLEFCR